MSPTQGGDLLSKFDELLAQSKRTAVALQRELETLPVSPEGSVAIENHLVAALCSLTAAGTVYAMTQRIALTAREEMDAHLYRPN